MERTGADIIVEYLQREGIMHIFGVLGSAVLDLMDSLARQNQTCPEERRIRYIPVQHEQAAAFAADGMARLTGKPAVCMCTVGPGATNATSGIAQAWAESSPVIALFGDVSTQHKGKGASTFHEIDQQGVFRPISKASIRLERGDRIIETLQQAFRIASAPRMGPVVLNIPRDIQRATWEYTMPDDMTAYRSTGRVRGDAREIERAARLLREAKSPVILAGSGVRWAKCQPDVIALAEMLDAPIVVSKKGTISDFEPYCAGIIGTTSSPVASEVIQAADVILALGCTFSQVMTASYGNKVIPAGAKIIHVDIDPTEIGKSYAVAVGFVADAKSAIDDLRFSIFDLEKANLKSKIENRKLRLNALTKRKQEFETALAPLARSNASPLKRLRLLRDLHSVLPEDAILGAEAGATHSWFIYGYPTRAPILEPGDFSNMGSAYCMAMGAAALYPERVVASVTGDGAFMMVLNELATCVAQQLNVIAVIPHNNLYGNMFNKQIKNFARRHLGTQLYIPNLAEVARAFGAHGERVERAEELVPALRRALASGKPAVVDVLIENSDEEYEPPTKLRVPDRY
jgi:thiamine pyrophosphate-dependent acetolactate synthase large subunit-like protein